MSWQPGPSLLLFLGFESTLRAAGGGCATMWRGRVGFPPDSAAKTPETGEDSQCKTSLPSTISRLALGAAPHSHSCLWFSSQGRCTCALRKLLDLDPPCKTAVLGPKRLQEANHQRTLWHIPSLEPGLPGDFLVAIMRCPYYSRGPDPEDSDMQCREKSRLTRGQIHTQSATKQPLGRAVLYCLVVIVVHARHHHHHHRRHQPLSLTNG